MVLPSGYGKSPCYGIPPVLFGYLAIISPHNYNTNEG
jgi:superfamily II DNA helicase RecQ